MAAARASRPGAPAGPRPATGGSRAQDGADPPAVATDTGWRLLTTATTRPAAVPRYRSRCRTAGTYRAVKAWAWAERVRALTDGAVVAGLTGLAVLS